MKKPTLLLTLAIAISFALASCGGETTETTNNDETENTSDTENSTESEEASGPAEYDLSEKGIPVVVTAPAGAEITKGMLAGEIDGTMNYSWDIKKDNFGLEVSMWDTEDGYTIEEAVAEDKEINAEEEGFEIVSEEANGYIYKYTIEGDEDYSFYYVKEKNGRLIEFTTALNLMDEYTLEDVQAMWAAAVAAK